MTPQFGASLIDDSSVSNGGIYLGMNTRKYSFKDCTNSDRFLTNFSTIK
jgi:hypothetical protein